jgi:hypothetical protein
MATYFDHFGTAKDDTFTGHDENENRRKPVYNDCDYRRSGYQARSFNGEVYLLNGV